MAEGDRERWDARHREAGAARHEPVSFLDEVAGHLPRRGRALDLASGRGRVALGLARLGLDTVACDVSPVGLALAEEAAHREGLRLDTVTLDLEVDPLPAGPWDVITCFHYLDRALLPRLAEALAPGGCLVIEIATVANLERHAHPPRRYLLETGELREAAGELDVLRYEEGWREDHHVARLLARRGTGATAHPG